MGSRNKHVCQVRSDMIKRFTEKEVVKVLLPSLVAVGLFIFTLSQIIVPSFREQLFAKKKESIQQVTEVASDILAFYQQQESAGLMTRKQAQDFASQQIKILRYGEEKKDYFWINDMGPTMVMHPYRCDLDGKDLSGFADPNGKKLFVEFVRTVQASDCGYVDYMWQWKDDPNRIVPKLSFVKAFTPWNWVVGTGVYVDDVEKEISFLTRRMITYSTFILAIVCLLSFYIIRQGLSAAERRKRADEQLRKHRDHLEEMVQERTAGLLELNNDLQEENRQRKEVEEKLRDQHGFLNSVLESLPYPFCVIDTKDFTVLHANGAARAFSRKTDNKCYEMLHNQDKPCQNASLVCPLEHVKQKKTSIIVEHIFYDKKEKPILLELHCYPVFDENGNVIQIIESSVDITERRKIQKNLERSEENFRTLIETANDAIFISDLFTEEILQVNKSAEDLLGLSASVIIGRNQSKLLYPQHNYTEFRRRFLNHCLEGHGILPDMSVGNKDGMLVPVEISVSVSDWGERQVVLGIFRDVTERKRMEKNLCQAHKMEAVGTLAGGIAHDFNNILTAILGFSEISLLTMPSDSPCRQNMKKVVQAGQRARDLVSQILTFSKFSMKDERRENIYLQKVIEDSMKLLSSTLPSTIDIKLHIQKDCGPVYADFTQMQQIVFNLCTNAYHAMRDLGGVLVLSLQEILMDEEECEEFPDLTPGHYAFFSVEDSGIGMDKITLARIFDPYFTTKLHGEGTGLGLASVQGIVRSHNGAIRVKSEIDQGSRFDMFFPIADNTGIMPVIHEEDCIASKLPQLSKKVLFVDDEIMIVQLGKMYLEQVGCKVTACNSSIKAYEKFMEDPAYFDVVVTDQTMPALTGIELAAKILAVRPDMPIIMITGYSDLVDDEKAKGFGIKEYLMKPLTIGNLLRAFERVLQKKKDDS